MSRLLTAAGLVAFLLAYSAPAAAVSIYVTVDQGYPFTAGTGSPSPEIDAIGDTGTVDFGNPGPTTVLLNLWIESDSSLANGGAPATDDLTVFSLRVNAVNGAVFTSTTAGIASGFANSATLGGGLVSSQVGGSFFTSLTSLGFLTACSNIPFGGAPHGNCDGGAQGFGAFAPEQDVAMLVATFEMDLSLVNSPALEVIAADSIFRNADGTEGFITFPGTGLASAGPAAAPEPAMMTLLGVALAGLAFLRRSV